MQDIENQNQNPKFSKLEISSLKRLKSHTFVKKMKLALILGETRPKITLEVFALKE